MSTTAPVTDQSRYVQLPNGSYMEWPQGVSADEFKAKAAKVPGSPPEQTPGLLDTMKRNFDSNTQGAQPGDGMISGGLKDIGAGGGDVVRAIAHPIDTIKSMFSTPDPGMAMIAKGLGDDTADKQIMATPHPSAMRTLGQIGTGAALGEVGGEALGAAGEAASGLKDFVRPSPSSSVVSPEEMAARNVAKTVLPPGGIKPEFLKSLQSELPAVKAYAQRTGNPLNTQMEGMKAAQGVAQEGLDHFNNNILGPVEAEKVTLGAGKTDLGSTATLRQVSDEIGSLNKQVTTAKASNAGDALTIMAKKGGVMDQLSYLRGVLYDNLSTKTGIPAEKLQTLREGYGGQYGLADNLESAENARLTRSGQRSQGQETINLKPPSLLELPSRFLTTVRGGEQAIADRQFGRALRPIVGAEPERPAYSPPSPPTPVTRTPVRGLSTELRGPDMTPQTTDNPLISRIGERNNLRDLMASTNREAASREVVNAHDLEQQAQSAADERASRAAAAREGRRATQSAQTKLEGEAARTIGRDIARKGGKK